MVGDLGITGQPVRLDSQAKYACMAAGNAEFLFRLLSPSRPDYRECIWDQAAGSIVIEEAGGRVTVRLKLNAKGKRYRKRLKKGVVLTLRITQGGTTVTRTLRLR